MTQRETAKALGTTRANVSMIEHRARRKVTQAEQTIGAYRSTLTDHLVSVPKGTWSYDIPALVLGEGDRLGIHLRSNMVEIVRLVRSQHPACLEKGKTSRAFSFVFNDAGKLRIDTLSV
jgi:Tfx family DNA-binding protein